MTFPQTINASASPEVQVNENFLGIAWTGCYSNKPSTTTGLVRGYNGGRWGGFSKSDENHTFGTSVTTYVSVDKSDGTLDFSTSNTNYDNDTDYARVEIVVTSGSAVTGVTDDRGGPGGVHAGGGSSGGGAVASVNGQTGAVVLALDDINDVSAGAPTDGYVLTWDSGTSTWRPEAPGSGALTNFTESLNTASPNNVTNAARLIVTGGSTNVDFVLSPKGSGALMANLPDSGTGGGNKRGTNAQDFQMSRATAGAVASGARSFAGGADNTVSGTEAVGLGGGNTASAGSAVGIGSGNTASLSNAVAVGRSNNATGQEAVALGAFSTASATGAHAYGTSCTADGMNSWASGFYSTVRGVHGACAWAGGRRSNTGDAQRVEVLLRGETTSASAVTLVSNASAAAVTNQLTLPVRSSLLIKGLICAHRQSNDDTSTWEFTAHLTRTVGGTVSLVSAVTPVLVSQSAGASTWAVTVAADNTLKTLQVQAAGQSSATVAWTCHLHSVEVAT